MQNKPKNKGVRKPVKGQVVPKRTFFLCPTPTGFDGAPVWRPIVRWVSCGVLAHVINHQPPRERTIILPILDTTKEILK